MRRQVGLVVAGAGLLLGVAVGCQPADSAQPVSAPGAAASRSAPAGGSATTPAATSPAQHKHAPPATRHHRAAAKRHVAAGGLVVLDHGRVVLPDRRRTPGAVNPAVTQATIRSTICRSGYTSTIRPSSSYTTGLKVQQLGSGYAFHRDRSTADYEEDHLIALELGGSPGNPRNLWPEPYAATGADTKDLVENELHDLVCSGRLPLRSAQRMIARNWWHAYQVYGGRAVPVVFFGHYGHPASTGGGTTVAGAPTARCVDGTLSYSQHRSGTCSHHGGVSVWLNPPPS